MSQVAGPFSPRVRWLLDSPVDIRMTRRRLSRGLRWMDHRARKSENLREVTDASMLWSCSWYRWRRQMVNIVRTASSCFELRNHFGWNFLLSGNFFNAIAALVHAA